MTPAGGTGAGILLMLASLACHLATMALARGLSAGYPPAEVLLLRLIASLPWIVLWMVAFGTASALRVEAPARHLSRTASGIGGALLAYTASTHLPFADLIAVCYSAPLFVVVISGLLGRERVPPLRVLLVAGGFAGTLLVVGPSGRVDGWAGLALLSATLNAWCALETRALALRHASGAMALVFVCLGALLALPVAAWSWTSPAAVDLPRFAALGLTAAAALILHAAAFRRAQASLLAPIDYLGVLAAIPIGSSVWSETVSWSMVAGASLILVTGAWQVRVPGTPFHPPSR